MEENRYIRNERMSIGQIYSESFRIFKENWLTYLVAAVTTGIVLGCANGLSFLFGQSRVYSLLLTIINIIATAIITTLYIGTAYNSMREDRKEIGALIGAKIIPIALTQLLLYVLLFIPGFIVMFGAIQFMLHTASSGSIIVITIMIFAIAIPVGLKMAFLLHSIVLSDQHYLSAIKWSFSKTKGEVLRIIAINIAPLSIAIVAQLVNAKGAWFSGMGALISLVILGVIGAIIGVIVVIAMTVLYIDKVFEQENTQIGETLTYG